MVSPTTKVTPLQRCVTHLKRGMLNKVRHGDKQDLADNLRQVFKTGDKDYTIEQACVGKSCAKSVARIIHEP